MPKLRACDAVYCEITTMTNISRAVAFIAMSALGIVSCKRDDASVSGPGITRQIRSFEDYACPGGTVTRYDFQNTEVFVFEQNCGVMDESYPVYDIDGKQICWIGGFGGIGECRGGNFYRDARNATVIFTKR